MLLMIHSCRSKTWVWLESKPSQTWGWLTFPQAEIEPGLISDVSFDPDDIMSNKDGGTSYVYYWSMNGMSTSDLVASVIFGIVSTMVTFMLSYSKVYHLDGKFSSTIVAVHKNKLFFGMRLLQMVCRQPKWWHYD